MTNALPSVPFWAYYDEDDNTLHGLARLETDVLTLEFQRMDTEEKLQGEIHHMTIRLADLDAVRFSRTVFSATLTLRVRSLSLLKEIPGARQGELKLRFYRKYRHEAHAWAARLQLRMSERKIKLIDEEMQKLDDAATADERNTSDARATPD